MESFLGFVFAFGVGSAGFFLAALCRIPNPALIGSMFATGILNLAGHFPDFPVWPVSLVANLLIGVMIGREIDRNILKRLRTLARPVFVQTVGILLLSVACGYTLHFMGGGKIDLLTSFIAAPAGGITEMVAFALSVDADASIVMLVQVFRVVVALSIMPNVAVICVKLGCAALKETAAGTRSELRAFSRLEYLPLALVAVAGAALGEWLGIPSGGLIVPVAACGLFAVCLNKVYAFNARLRFAAQTGLGLVMGQRMTWAIAVQLWQTLLPAVAVTVVMIIGCTLLGLLLHRTTGWDLILCLLCAAPAGLSQITVYADEIGVDSLVLTVFHTVRILSIVVLYPLIILPMAGA